MALWYEFGKGYPMKWDRNHNSPNVEDRRGQSVRAGAGGGLIFLVARLIMSKFGFGGLVVVGIGYVVATQFFGLDMSALMGGGTSRSGAATGPVNDEAKAFVASVFDGAQDLWTQQFRAAGQSYRPARLVLFTAAVRSGCGTASASTGPFYCPGDQKVYIDLSFYQQLRTSLGAPGDFAQAYVIAHEVGHHVQNLQGFLGGSKNTGADSHSVRIELQADCYAGMWAHAADKENILDDGDLQEALNAAQAIGDDRLQRKSTGVVRPESFSHGTSEQRMRWFKKGLDSGDMKACDTMAAKSL